MKHTGPGLSQRMKTKAHFAAFGVRSVDTGIRYYRRARRNRRQLTGIELINAAHRGGNDDGGPSAA